MHGHLPALDAGLAAVRAEGADLIVVGDKDCSTCGNPIPTRAARCPFCDSPQAAPTGIGRAEAAGIPNVNLKRGQPTVAEAIRRLDMKIAEFHARGVPLVRVIHGWGSSGTGGQIRVAARNHLLELRRRKLVRRFVAGEEYSDASVIGRELRDRYPALKAGLRSDSQNPGITLVEIVV